MLDGVLGRWWWWNHIPGTDKGSSDCKRSMHMQTYANGMTNSGTITKQGPRGPGIATGARRLNGIAHADAVRQLRDVDGILVGRQAL